MLHHDIEIDQIIPAQPGTYLREKLGGEYTFSLVYMWALDVKGQVFPITRDDFPHGKSIVLKHQLPEGAVIR